MQHRGWDFSYQSRDGIRTGFHGAFNRREKNTCGQ